MVTQTFLLFTPSEQQRGPVGRQRHRRCHAFLRRYISLCGYRPRPPRGRGWQPQSRTYRRQRRERTDQGGGGSSGAGLPHSPGAVCRSPPLDSLHTRMV